MLEHINFARSLVVRLQNVLVCLIDFLMEIGLHYALESLDSIAFHSF